MKKFILLTILLLWAPLAVQAATYEIFPKVAIELPELPADWTAGKEAPMEMIDHITEHVLEAAADKGKKISKSQAMEIAKKRLQKEELFLYNTVTGAHITVSFEALGPDETAPTQEDITRSAKLSASSVGDEGWVDVTERYPAATIPGADAVQRFEIDYTHEGKKGSFIGLVGFTDPFWFWFYGTDHRQSPQDREAINHLFNNLKIQKK